MEVGCTSSDDLAHVAGLATLGVPVRPMWTLHEKRGKERVRFELGLVSADGGVRTKAVLRDMAAGTMPAWHPFLICLRACENRECLMDLQNQGIPCELRPVEGAPGIWEYVQGPGVRGLPGLEHGVEYFHTRDLHLTAALGLAGYALAHLEGPKGGRTYYMRRSGPVRPTYGPLEPLETARLWRTDRDKLPAEEPVRYGLQALKNRDDLLDSMKGRGPLLILQPKGEGLRRATIQLNKEGNAGDQAWERAERFLG